MIFLLISIGLLFINSIVLSVGIRRSNKLLERRQVEIVELKKHIDFLKGKDLRIYGSLQDATGYTLVQLETTALIDSSKIDNLIPALGNNVTLVHHEILEQYNAADFKINEGGDVYGTSERTIDGN